MDYLEIVNSLSAVLDGIGIILIVIGSLWSLCYFVISWNHHHSLDSAYSSLRKNLGRTIIVGLEFLIAGDILQTIATPTTLQSVAILGAIVIIRTFLSINLQKEIDGMYPWQKTK